MPAIRRRSIYKYIIANKCFRTKDEIIAHVRRVKKETSVGEIIQDPVILALLRLNPNWSQKSRSMTAVGLGMIKGSPGLPGFTKEIVILNGDAEFTRISWKKVVQGMQADGTVEFQADNLTTMRKAARNSVHSQIEPLMMPGMHVDHVFPATFEQLLSDWFQTHPELLKISDVRIITNGGNVVNFTWEDAELEKDWIEFHKKHAHLEIVTAVENLKRPKVYVDWTPWL